MQILKATVGRIVTFRSLSGSHTIQDFYFLDFLRFELWISDTQFFYSKFFSTNDKIQENGKI